MKNVIVKKITINSPDFPSRLVNIPNPPSTLYSRGKLPNSNELAIAIVGSRKHSAYGRAVTRAIVETMRPYQPWIISGLALGIDAIAHRAALENNLPTLALLPSGADKVHLATNYQLGQKILESGGGWLSELPSGTTVQKSHFLVRNRLISGLADAIVVIEAGQRSGTLSTARHALEQGRELIAVPGPITSATSRGTNQLIQAGAHCLSKPEDIPAILDLKISQSQPTRYQYSDDNQRLIHELLLNYGQLNGDSILNKLSMQREQYLSAITMLELNGLVFAHGGDLWSAK